MFGYVLTEKLDWTVCEANEKIFTSVMLLLRPKGIVAENAQVIQTNKRFKQIIIDRTRGFTSLL